ncbi:MAG: aldo/keto reductase [Clostridiales bacterium]|nr:aldo/keto reductase [Clostridiales bacterium]
MTQITLGKTGLRVEQNGFGALPLQRISHAEAVRLLQAAHDGGMTFFDTARGYTDSEEKLGLAYRDRRSQLVIATKTPAKTARAFWADLETSLRLLKTDTIDIYQFHNPAVMPVPGAASGLYEAMLQAKEQGKIRYIGITNHRLDVARQAALSGLYDTLQFPFSYLSEDREIELVQTCRAQNVGFIAMKALSGGLITHAAAACAWLTRFDQVVPIWGIQRMRELDEFLAFIANPPKLTDELQAVIDADRHELGGDFCRGCGYCMPCPQGIEINTCARMSLLIRRAPSEALLGPAGQEKMRQVAHCIDCGQCSAKCPYNLDTPALLRKNARDYQEVLAGKMP